MDTPLVGTPKQNYHFFYGASLAAIVSLIVLFIITGYTAGTASEINEVIKDMNVLLQEAKHLFGSIAKDMHLESKYWNIKSNKTSKEK